MSVSDSPAVDSRYRFGVENIDRDKDVGALVMMSTRLVVDEVQLTLMGNWDTIPVAERDIDVEAVDAADGRCDCQPRCQESVV